MTPSEAKRKALAALERQHRADYPKDCDAVNPWDDLASWEIKGMIKSIIDDAFKVKSRPRRVRASPQSAANLRPNSQDQR